MKTAETPAKSSFFRQKFRFIILAVLLLTACQSAQVQERIEDAKTVAETVTNPNAPTENEIEAAKGACDDADTPEEAESCAKTEFDQANAELSKIYGEIMSKFKQDSANESNTNGAETAKKNTANLKETQEKWLAYRDAVCDAEKMLAEKDENPNFIDFNCRQRMTEQRIEDLKLIYTK